MHSYTGWQAARHFSRIELVYLLGCSSGLALWQCEYIEPVVALVPRCVILLLGDCIVTAAAAFRDSS